MRIGTVFPHSRLLVICGIKMTRYNNASSILYKNFETKGRLRDYSWLKVKPADTDIRTFKVTTQTAGAPRRIANILYQDHNLFWVLTMFNNRWYNDARALNVLNWPVAGQILYYPVSSVINPTLT